MSEPFYAEVRMLPYTYAPRDWAKCDGALMKVADNPALFSLLGTTYGGDGRITMGLPNLKGRAPLGAGTGPGLTRRNLGSRGGQDTVVLKVQNLPAHSHLLYGIKENPSVSAEPEGFFIGKSRDKVFKQDPNLSTTMSSGAVGAAGGNYGHDNRQPFLVLQFCIALEGIYPPRN